MTDNPQLERIRKLLAKAEAAGALAGAFHERSMMITTNRLFAVTFDCVDATVVGGFWAQALGQELDPGASKEFASIGCRTLAGPSCAGASPRSPKASQRRTGCIRT